MTNQFFDSFEFHRICRLVYLDPYQAKILFEDYFNRYPNDYASYPYYASLLINMGQFDKASRILDFVEQQYSSNIRFMSEDDKVNFIRNNICFARLRLFSYRGQYDKFLEFYQAHSHEILFSNPYLNQALFLAKLKTNQLSDLSMEYKTYIYRQMVEYQEDDFLHHIKKHFSQFQVEGVEPDVCLFSEDFPFQDVFSEVKKYIPSSKKTFSNFIDNVYIFCYDGCGKVHNRMQDFFKVVTFHNSQKFITMYPSVDCARLPYVDLNYINYRDNSRGLVKKKSQIDKFYDKYKNM